MTLSLHPSWRSACLAGCALLPNSALAHVKWFAPYDSEATPVALHQVLSLEFWSILALFFALLTGAIWVERSAFGSWAIARFDQSSAGLRPKLDILMHAGTAVFFTSLWVIGGVFITPELTTELSWVPWLQMLMVVALFWQRTMVFTALGIVCLWGMAALNYGVFHLLDYPIFLGIALYLALCSFPQSRYFPRRFDILRWGAAITLMWASIEKFAYPEWSFPLLDRYPALSLGLSDTSFMTLAGLAEFVLAFALLCTPLVRRSAALFLAVIFVAAVIPFGKIDAIGHMMIIFILVVIAADDGKVEIKALGYELASYHTAALAVYMVVYYGLQGLFYNQMPPSALVAYHLGEENRSVAHYDAQASLCGGVDNVRILPGGTPLPTLSAHSEQRTDGTWLLRLETTNFTFSDVEHYVPGPIAIGHAHVFIDGQKAFTTYTPELDLGSLAAGSHVIRVSLQSPDHRSFTGADGRLFDTVVLIQVPSVAGVSGNS